MSDTELASQFVDAAGNPGQFGPLAQTLVNNGVAKPDRIEEGAGLL